MSHTADPTKTHVRNHLSEAKRKLREAEVAFTHGVQRTSAHPSVPRSRAKKALLAAIRDAGDALEAIERFDRAEAERERIMERVRT